jgi:hypothetical protein
MMYIINESQPENFDHGYPSTVEMPDGSLMTSYYQMYENDVVTSILGTRWEL